MSSDETDITRVGIMHVTDTLDAGGAERVAVNLVNHLPRQSYRTYLCATRRAGLLAGSVAADVELVCLERQRRFDGRAFRRLVAFIRARKIQVLHAHGTSLFIAALASLFPPHPAVIWHNHFGRLALEDRRDWLRRLAAKQISGVIAVNRPLAEWSRRRLCIPAHRVWYIPNFVDEARSEGTPPRLPGKAGARIICVANLQAEKDHLTLLRALALVVRRMPVAHLLLVGAGSDPRYVELLRQEIASQNLGQHVSLLGQRLNVPDLLRACDIGVLSSASEGLPLALIEYGGAGLPVVATKVGQCAEVLDEGRAGLLVPPAAPEQLAEALYALLSSPDRRAALGSQLHRRVREVYSPDSVIQQICLVYDTVIGSRRRW